MTVDTVSALSSDSSGFADKVTSPGEGEAFFTDGEKFSKKRKISQKTKTTVKLPLHINGASAQDLCALNGVGPKLAEKIIAFREAFGPFKSAKDLQKVPGIGKKKLESILPGVIFD